MWLCTYVCVRGDVNVFLQKQNGLSEIKLLVKKMLNINSTLAESANVKLFYPYPF